MNKNQLCNSVLLTLTGLALVTQAWASTPVWTFAPMAGYPPSLTLSANETGIIQYTVTNQSRKPHTLRMNAIQGISASGCTAALGYHQSCMLTLTVKASAMKSDIMGGPVLCAQGNPNQCYQPSQANSLAIRLSRREQYTITPSSGANGTINPSNLQTVKSGATLTFTATPAAGYGVANWLVDGQQVQSGGTKYSLTNIKANHAVTVQFGQSTITPSVSTLALSVKDTATNPALTGIARKIIITNTGSAPATNVQVIPNNLPLGTTVNAAGCSTVAANNGTCELIITPGAAASDNCTTGTTPTGSLNITADPGLSETVNVYVIGYGCQYQGGFVFAVNDTTAITGSIGGKVASLENQQPAEPNGIVWDADPTCSTPPFQCIRQTNAWDYRYGQNLAQVLGSSNPNNSGTNGPGNTWQISNVLNGTGGNTNNPANYAAGVCISYTDAENHNDWYLPALCDMGTGGCAAELQIQNIENNLNLLLGNSCAFSPNCLAGVYWSSTEVPEAPQSTAWSHSFSNRHQDYRIKFIHAGVRCIRDF